MLPNENFALSMMEKQIKEGADMVGINRYGSDEYKKKAGNLLSEAGYAKQTSLSKDVVNDIYCKA